MREIALSRGKVAFVDDSDYEFLNQHKWSALHPSKTRWYAVRRDGERLIYMHHVLLPDVPKPLERDHEDGNGLNNQRHNLRILTHRRNALNTALRADNKTGLRGVHFDKQTGKYRASIRVNGITTNFPRRSTREEAAMDYDCAAIAANGEFAKPNMLKGTLAE